MGSFATKLSNNNLATAGGTASGFGATLYGKDGSGTERSTYMNKDSDKSFVSASGLGTSSHGAVGGIGGLGSGGLDSSLMNNILSTPSSEKSHGRTSAFSPDDQHHKQ